MPTIRPVHSSAISVMNVSSVNIGLTNNQALSLGVFDTNDLNISDLLLTVDIGFANYTDASSASIYMLPSPDGTVFPAGISSSSLYGRGVISIDPANTPSLQELVLVRTAPNLYWCGMLSRFVGTLPPFFALLVHNRTGYGPNTGYSHRAFVNYTTYEYV
jgi:hypothetical protein